ncbi:type II secretion system protein GspL [Pseudomonas capeferrum]
MKPRLYLNAEGLAEPSAQWPCTLWSAGQPGRPMTLAQGGRGLIGQAVELLLPMELCSWVRTDPWPSRRHPGAQAIAFAVEDQLSEPLEALHLGIGARDAQGCYPVMVVNRERFTAVLALMTQAGVAVCAVFVDADVLPGDQPVALHRDGRWLLGGGLPARLVLCDEGLSQLEPALPAELRRLEADHVDQLLCARPTHAIDLLSGEFALRRTLMPWRSAGISLLTLALLSWAGSEARVSFLQGETRELAARNEQRFKVLYPDQPRIADLAMQLKALQRQRAEPQHTHIARLVSLMDRVVGASSVEVQRIDYRQGEGWKVQLTANSFAELEQLRERGRQQGMPVRLESASQQHNRVHVSLAMEDEA